MSVSENHQLLSPARISRTLTRIAFQIIEDNTESLPICLCGIDERGHALAQSISGILNQHRPAQNVSCFKLPVKNEGPAPELSILTNSFAIIIDDVIFSGNTMFSALRMIDEHRPKMVKVAALVDRGHRSYPVEADYTGIVSPTKLNEHVRCLFGEGNTPLKVVINRN